MHDTAYEIGGLVMQTYCDLTSARILEIGSYDVNGSLRGNALPQTSYVGLDWEAGPGVDLVCHLGKPLPVDDASFDLVMASSVFEHDPAFWMTFVEMCQKTKPGGYIYVSAPSNGVVHRFPQDNWRFYPDAGLCLVQWAKARGEHVTLIESFVGERSMMWNDFCAVFRKGDAGAETLPPFVYERVACTNVITWQGGEVRLQRDYTEDMILLERGRDAVAELEVRAERAEEGRAVLAMEHVRLNAHLDDLRAAVRTAETYATEVVGTLRELQAERETMLNDRGRAMAHLEEMTNHRSELQSMLLQREKEATESWAELAAVRIEMDMLAARALDAETRADEGDQRVHRLSGERAALEAAGNRDRQAKDAADAQISELFGETAALARFLRAAEARIRIDEERVEWLREINRLRFASPWWWGLMPLRWQQQRELRRLKRRGLFDGEVYLALHPDVAAVMNPLRHYILHGMNEGRAIQ